MIVDCAVYRDGMRTEGYADFSGALEQARASTGGFVWVGLHQPTKDEFDLLGDVFGLHPLAVEDALEAHQRPKLEVYDGSLFVALKPVVYEAESDTVSTGELMVFLGDAFVVTVRHGEGAPLKAVVRRLDAERELPRAYGPTAVLYAVVDAVVDHYLEVAAELQTDLQELEAEVFSPDGGGSQAAAARIYTFKRQIQEFRRATGPLTAPLARLAGVGPLAAAVPFVDGRVEPFFRDVADHVTRVNESMDSLDRLVSDALSAYLAQVGVRQNDDMRKISAWAALIALPTLIAGVYGMNFEHMPELHWVWAYPAVIGVMAVFEVLLFRLFRRRGWL
ncbi:magnesium and cobalt transport protein CorA [Kitasatospora sp. NBC_01539]|uniref:magnesium and cobalt transport protein CorA n=1 Tax=Kitasatospora sp. NBC_01539 TaxID=2903577 RepID=UPI0038600E92